jgi:dehydrogenase/reductase SDR family protein 7B
MKSFSGKVVWVTGASAGIGEALVKAFAKEGAKVILTARREEELLRVQKEAGLNDTNSLILPVDLMKVDTISAAAEKARQKFPDIDILVCNAGRSQRSLVKDTSLEVDRSIMELNYFAAVALTKSVLPGMIARKQGHFVVISSVMGKMSVPLRSAYCASKHALHGFFDGLRTEEFKDNIKVTIICPGYVKTNVSVNAMTGTGAVHGKMEEGQAKGMTPETCARKTLRAIKRNREEVYMGGTEILPHQVKRFFPRVFSYIIKRLKFH